MKGMGIAAIALIAAAFPSGATAQSGTISGTVTDQTSGAPLSTVQIYLQGTSRNTLSSATGTFTITDVPAGTYTVIAQRIGFQEGRQANVVIGGGQTVTISLQMNPMVLALQEIVATGLVDPVEGVRSPISVGRVTREAMPVAASGSAVQNLQGRVAGVQVNRASGAPGSGVSMMLRTPTSVRQSGFPMVVVDGVIVGGVLADPNTTSIDGADIESIEVIRGAAAASLYGSRAAAGVISITTSRGQALQAGQTLFSARSEMGFTSAFRSTEALANHHWYWVDNPTNPTTYVDANGNPVARKDRDLLARRSTGNVAVDRFYWFQDKPYPDPIYDNLSTLWQPGVYQNHNFSVAQNTQSTNFAISMNRTVEGGSVEGIDGYNRNSLRANLDHRFAGNASLGMSMYHAREASEDVVGAFFGPSMEYPRDVDLSAKDPATGQYLQNPDPEIELDNPLWTQATRETTGGGTRTMANLNLRWEPFHWMTASANGSYDRRDDLTRAYIPKGILAAAGVGTATTGGSITYTGFVTDTWNAEAQVSLRYDFGPLNARLTGRSLLEKDRTTSDTRFGRDFIVAGIPTIQNTPLELRSASSAEREIRALGYLGDLAFDYDGKYILTTLIRRDGSSLFGQDNRWHNYYRVAGAWRLSQESWFNLPNVDEFKLSFARGTAGGRPSWAYQYETFSINSTTGALGRNTLGNRNLRPEHTTENEASLDMILFNRFGVKLTHAWQETTEQLTEVALPSFVGFPSQWINQGAVSGRTTEFSVDGTVIDRPTFNWSTIVTADKSYSEITRWDVPCTQEAYRWYCDVDQATGGPVPIYGIYGSLQLTSFEQLKTHGDGRLWDLRDQFQINDEGLLVWVGEFDYTDGLVNGEVTPGTWGTLAPISATAGNVGELWWGTPIYLRNPEAGLARPQIGNSNPLNIGWINNLRVRGFNFHTQFHASIGADANNEWFAGMTRTDNLNTPYQDQSGKPDGLKKPQGYYRTALSSAGYGYAVEDATYLKLRTLGVNYRLNPSQLQRVGLGGVGVESLQVGLVGRNIFTITNFSGFDPEQSLNLNNRANVGGAVYPSTRTFTAEVSVTF